MPNILKVNSNLSEAVGLSWAKSSSKIAVGELTASRINFDLETAQIAGTTSHLSVLRHERHRQGSLQLLKV